MSVTSGDYSELVNIVVTLLTVGSFANGIEMSPDENYLLYTETGRAKLHKYHLSGPKAGTNEVLVDSLPGLPDNIK